MRKHIVLFCLIVLSTSAAWAQVPYSACFTVDTDRGCAPLTVTTTSCSQSGPGVGQPLPSYVYDLLGAAGTSTQLVTKTYTIPGNYTIQQTVNDGVGFTVTTTKVIQVLGKPAPVFTAQACAGLVVKVDITDTNYDLFLLDYGDGTPATVVSAGTYNYVYSSAASFTVAVTGQYSIACTGATATKSITSFSALVTPDILDLTVTTQSTLLGTIELRYAGIIERSYAIESKSNNGPYGLLTTAIASATGAQTQTLTNLNTQANTHTFRIRNNDVCGNFSAYSAQIASILIGTTVLNGSNQVNFSSNGGLVFSDFLLNRNANSLQNNAVSPATDNTVICGNDYCYQVVGTLPTTSTTLASNHKSYTILSCVKANYSGAIPTISTINSTVEGETVKVVWDTPLLNAASAPVSFYTIYREDNSVYANYGSSNSISFIDNQVKVNTSPYCYKISYKDPCNAAVNSTLSPITCSVHLTVTKTGELSDLAWTAYSGYSSGIKEYVIENLDLNGNVVSSKSVGLVTAYSETTDQTLAQLIYRIKVVANGVENLESLSNQVKLDLTPQLFMPTVFTPNNDGENDILFVKGKYFQSMKLTILNKWGEVVFISTDASIGWDGNYKGGPASVDAYAYKVVALDNSGGEVSLNGVISLVR